MRTILLLLCLFSPLFLLSQENDLIWQFGYGQSWNEPGLGGALMDFRTIPPTISPHYRLMNFLEANASFCDGAGNLLFYTNGLSVANAEDEQMENGGGLNPGQMADDMLGMGYRNQSIMTLPSPAGGGLYYLFHSPQEYPDDFVGWHSPFLYATTIDMNLNGGLGKVTDKNMPIIADTLDLSQCTAARHANGRSSICPVRFATTSVLTRTKLPLRRSFAHWPYLPASNLERKSATSGCSEGLSTVWSKTVVFSSEGWAAPARFFIMGRKFPQNS